VQMAKENSGWSYDRIVGALANLGHVVSDQTVSNILRRHGIAPAPEHDMEGLHCCPYAVLAGIDFFTVAVLTWRDWLPTMFYSSFIWRVGV
jgi:putative transposase